MENTTIYYFTGTGNSLQVAKELQQRLTGSRLIPIVKALKDEMHSNDSKCIGFVFPCHGFTLPIPVKRFIDKFDPSESEYLFAVATRGGTSVIAFDYISAVFPKKNKSIDSTFIINMPGNDPKFKDFTMPSEEELDGFDRRLTEECERISKIVSDRSEFRCSTNGSVLVKNPFLEGILEKLIAFSVHNIAPRERNYFYITDDCCSCGICSKVCTSGKISIKNGRPLWERSRDCYMCYACLNFCPSGAIQIHNKYYMKSYTAQNKRYTNRHVKPADIEDQKG